MYTLTETQINTVEACKNNISGIITNTCGTGKTFIEIEVINNAFENNANICALGSHRLCLNTQLTENYKNYIEKIKKNINNIYQNKIKIIEISSNNNSKADRVINEKDEILAEINYAKTHNTKLLIIFCYASISKLVNALENFKDEKQVDLCIFDEAHIGQMNEKYIGDINTKFALCKHSKHFYFFTSTPKSDLLNNDLKLKIIYSYSYYEALKNKEVVPFKFYGSYFENSIILNSNKKIGQSRLGTEIAAYKHLSKKFEFPSLLIFGTSLEENAKQYEYLFNEFKLEIENGKLDLISFSSEKNTKDGLITSMINNKSCKVKDCFLQIKEKNKKKIIINCDMLSEGIDLPDINGVLIFGEKSSTSLYQAIMRGCRLHPDDRNNNNELIKKPYFNLYTSFEETENANQMRNFIRNLKEFGINITEDFMVDQFNGQIIEENNKIRFNDDFINTFKKIIDMEIKEDKELSITIDNENIINTFRNQFNTIKLYADRIKFFKNQSILYPELSLNFAENFNVEFKSEYRMNGISNPLYEKTKILLNDDKNKNILVINDFFQALILSLGHQVIYLTNDETCSREFNKYVNDEQFGNNDEAIYIDKTIKDKWLTTIKELNMKFDYIIGNPPYGKLHLKILEESYKTLKEDGKLIFVHPSTWCSDLAYYTKNKKIDIQKYFYLPFQEFEVIKAKKANKIFNIAICADGLVISTIDKTKDPYYKSIDDLVIDVKEKTINSKYLKSIYQKIKAKMPANLSSYASFGKIENIKYLLILKEFLSNNGESISSYNLTSSNHGVYKNGIYNNKTFEENRNQQKNKDGTINFRNDARFIEFNTEKEAENCLNSFKTLFYRFITMMLNNAFRANLKAMPFMIDYTNDWTNERFYEFFDISLEEQEEIKKIMKPYV